MPDRQATDIDRPDDRLDNPEAALGGADAVEKTTYVTGSGTEPEARREGPSGRAPSGRGVSTPWVIIISLFVAAVGVYLLGYGR